MNTKPKNKHERNAVKALARSKRNSPRPKPKTRKVRGLVIPRSALETMKVDDLRSMCLARDIKVTTKTRKAELIDLLVKS